MIVTEDTENFIRNVAVGLKLKLDLSALVRSSDRLSHALSTAKPGNKDASSKVVTCLSLSVRMTAAVMLVSPIIIMIIITPIIITVIISMKSCYSVYCCDWSVFQTT